MKQISANRIRQLFGYDPSTGILTNKIRRAKAEAGAIAGSRRKDGYLTVSIDCSGHYLVHRVIWLWMTGEWIKDQIDHADLDRSNNKWSNLRRATPAQNNANRTVSRLSGTGIKGAFFHAETGKYRARIQVGGKQISLGLHSTPELAGAAYLKAAISAHGDFARGAE